MAIRSREKAEKYIHQHLGALNPDGRLPSLRRIITECEVSQLIAQDVLREFEKKDLIYSVNRKGYFKRAADESMQDFGELDLIYCPSTHDREPMLDFHGSFSHFIGMFCGRKWRSVRMHFLEDHLDIDNLNKIAESSKCRACILVSSPTLKIGEILRQNYVSYVNLFPNSDQLDKEACNIVIDNDKVVSLQVNHLVELGHRKIAYLHLLRPGETIRDLLARREAFFKYALGKGLQTNPDWVLFGGYDSATTMRVMSTLLQKKELPTAVICSDMHLPAVYKALEMRGIVPGTDFSVIGENNLGISSVLWPPASTIDMSVEKASLQSLTALELALADRSYKETIFIEPELIKRESTSTVSKAQ